MGAQDHFPKRKISFLLSAAAHPDGSRPVRHPPARAVGDGPPTIGYLDPVFVEMMEELKGLLRYAFQTEERADLPGLRPRLGRHGDVLRQHGQPRRQGHRLPQRRVRRPHDRERRALRRHCRWWSRTRGATPVDPNKVEDALRSNPDAKIVAFVHAETSTGVRPTPRRIAAIAQAARRADHRGCGHLARRHAGAGRRLGHRRRLLGQPEVPVVHAGPVAGHFQRPRGRAACKARKEKVHSWFMDLNLLLGYWGADHAHLPPHRADQFALRAARGAAHAAAKRAWRTAGRATSAITWR